MAEYDYVSSIIKKGDYKSAKDYLNELNKVGFYQTATQYMDGINYVERWANIESRVDDHIMFQNRLTTMENEFREKMNSALESDRKRIIEVLGFFSGIIAFILSTVSIGKSFSFTQALFFIIGLGIVLIMFTSSISIMLTESKDNILKKPTFWILVFGLFIMFTLIICTDNIASIVGNLKPNDD